MAGYLCDAPDPGRVERPERPDKRADDLFWAGFRLAQRTGTALLYLEPYRHTKRFGELVTQAEGMLAHHAGCECQNCTGAA